MVIILTILDIYITSINFCYLTNIFNLFVISNSHDVVQILHKVPVKRQNWEQ